MDNGKNDQLQLCLGVPNPLIRDQLDLMRFPFFSLGKQKRVEPIVYSRDGVSIIVRGLPDIGIATIWDADFLIWAASTLNEAREKGKVVSPRLWVVPFQYFRYVKRIKNAKGKGGKTYQEFKLSLIRLQGTQIVTNISAGNKHVTEAWSWIDTFRAHEDADGNIHGVDVVLSDWFFRRVIIDRSVLSISTEYFLLTGGIERWLYKIARKHCGANDTWYFTINSLYDKYPTGREYRKFKSDLKAIVKADCLPEYHTDWDEEMQRVTFRLRDGVTLQRKLPRSMRESSEVGVLRTP